MADKKGNITIVCLDANYTVKETIAHIFPYIIEKQKKNESIKLPCKKAIIERIMQFAKFYSLLSKEDQKKFEERDILIGIKKDVALNSCFGALENIKPKNLITCLNIATVLKNQYLINILCANFAKYAANTDLETLRDVLGYSDDFTEKNKEIIGVEDKYLEELNKNDNSSEE